jgi:hypothetical protein
VQIIVPALIFMNTAGAVATVEIEVEGVPDKACYTGPCNIKAVK